MKIPQMHAIVQTPGGFHAEVKLDCTYSPDVLDDVIARARQLLAAAHAEHFASTAGDVDHSEGAAA